VSRCNHIFTKKCSYFGHHIWIERFWKTIKYNHIYLNPCDTGLELYEGVQTYIEYYHQKKHQGIGMKPNDAYYKSLKQNAA
jgi:putative transposase